MIQQAEYQWQKQKHHSNHHHHHINNNDQAPQLHRYPQQNHPQLSPSPLSPPLTSTSSTTTNRKYLGPPYHRHRHNSHYHPHHPYLPPPMLNEHPRHRQRSMSEYSSPPTSLTISLSPSSSSFPPTPKTPSSSKDNNNSPSFWIPPTPKTPTIDNNDNNNTPPYWIAPPSPSSPSCRILDSHSTPINNKTPSNVISITTPPPRITPSTSKLVFNFKKNDLPLRRHHSLDIKPTYLTTKKHCNCCPPSKPSVIWKLRKNSFVIWINFFDWNFLLIIIFL